MIELIIKDIIECKNLPASIIKLIANDLTFDNPLYVDAVKHGRYIKPDVMPKLTFYDTEYNNTRVPKGYISFLKKILTKHNLQYTIIDHSVTGTALDLTLKGELRPYQEEAVASIIQHTTGFLDALTGSGKTIMMCALIAKRNTSTLIVVHSKELLYQWQNTIKKFLNYDCGLLGDNKKSIKPITVGIVNTVSKNIQKLRSYFGYLILDEGHRLSSSMWLDVILNMRSKYINACSATTYRRDGLTDALFYIAGPIIHKVNEQELTKTGAVLIPDIIHIQSDFICNPREDYTSVIKALTLDVGRNTLLYKTIRRDLNTYSEPVLFVSDRVAHCKLIAGALKKHGITTAVLAGKMNKLDRKRISKKVRAGKVQVLLSTISLIGEGFDSPILSALILGTPVSFTGRLTQVGGRILRPSNGKAKPRIYDIVDPNVRLLRGSMFRRRATYKKLGWL